MAWFRFYEETANDPKFAFIARKTGHPVAYALAVWTMILSRASAAEDRGNASGFDCESADAALGIPDGAAQEIYNAMLYKGMILDNGRVANWEKRQPKKEDNNSTQRSKDCRERQKAQKEKIGNSDRNDAQCGATDCNAMQRLATPCNDAQRGATPDKSRLEESFKNFKDTNVSLSSPPAPDASNPSFLNLPETPTGNPPSTLAGYLNRLPSGAPEASADPAGEYEPPNKANIPKPDGKSAIPPCPHKRIIAAYHEELPELPQVKVWDGVRAKRLGARWKERCLAGKYQSLEDGLDYWRRLFRHIRANCPFLMGKVESRDGRVFYADLAWLTRPENFAKLIEGKYDKKAIAA